MRAARKPGKLIIIQLAYEIEPLAIDVLYASVREGFENGGRAIEALKASGAETPKTLDDAINDAASYLADACALLAIAQSMTLEGQVMKPAKPGSFGRLNAQRKTRQRRAYP